MQRWKDREDVAAGKNISILNQVDPDRVSVVSENREYIKLLLQYHIFFVKNELAYRGKDETEESISCWRLQQFILPKSQKKS